MHVFCFYYGVTLVALTIASKAVTVALSKVGAGNTSVAVKVKL